MKFTIKLVLTIVLFASAALLAINFYGLTKELRPDNLSPEFLRFGERDLLLSKKEYFKAVKKVENESDLEYAKRLTTVISEGTAHVDWEVYNPSAFHQLVPLWENWILYFMGRYSGIPEYERYHFSNPQKSMERGIGICGDASILMSQLLSKHGIDNKIVTFPGHVVVAAEFDKTQLVFDPDFGVVIPHSLEKINTQRAATKGLYSLQGYSNREERFLVNEYTKSYSIWDGPKHLITNKFYFEKFAYFGKWFFPVFGVLFVVVIFLSTNKSKKE